MCYNCDCAGYHEMNLDWLIQELKNALAEWDIVQHDWEETKQYITDYFANLDVQEEINTKLDEMLESGELGEIISKNIVYTPIASYNNAEPTDITGILKTATTNVGLKGGVHYTVSDDVTCLAEIIVPSGTDITVSDGKTLTLKGGVVAGIGNIFKGTGNVVITNGIAYPEWFGAKGDGSTDDYPAFQKLMGSGAYPVVANRTYVLSKPVYSPKPVINSGAFPENKIIENETYRYSSFPWETFKYVARSAICNEPNTAIQSVVWVDSTNSFVFGFSKTNDLNNCVLVQTAEDLTVQKSNTIVGGHANDLTYDKKRNKIYLASGTGTTTNQILVINPETLTIERTYAVGTGAVNQVSYDSENDIVYSIFDGKLNTLDPDTMEITHSVPYTPAENIGYSGYTGQGSIVIDGDFYLMYQKTPYLLLISYDYNTGKVKHVFHRDVGTPEPEAMTEGNGKIYLMSGQSYVSLYRCDKLNFDSCNNFNLAAMGTPIAKNTDIWDLMHLPGKYYCESGEVADTLQHLPKGYNGGGFTMYIIRLAYDHFWGVIVSNATRTIYVSNSGSDNYGGWRPVIVGPDKGETVSINDTFGGIITSSGNLVNVTIPLPAYFSGYAPVLDGNMTVYIRVQGTYVVNNKKLNDPTAFDNYSAVIRTGGVLSISLRLKTPATQYNNFPCAVSLVGNYRM